MGNKALTTTYAYDALNRLTSAHEVGVGLNTTRTYEYDTLGNLIRQEEDGCIEYKYNGYSLDETTKCGTIPNSIGTSYWEYTYDGRGNLVSNDKYTRTTSGMAWQNEESYVYDETNHMVQGTNELGEVSIYTYNGLGIRVGRELIMKDNTHGYTDFHTETPSVETGIDKPEVVKESYVIDYTSATYNTLVMDEVGGFNYRWTYGLERLSLKVTSEGTNWWGQHVTTNILKDYLHQDRMGSTTNLTDQFGRVVGRADYNEWGEITYKEALDITSSYRRIYPQLNYTGYDWDDVLGMYYAKARFYSADDKRFVAMDPIKGSVVDPMSLVSYLYCVDNPLRWVDPLGLRITPLSAEITGSNVNFRAEPSLTATSYLQFQKGMRVVDLGRRVDADGYRWANVQYNGLTGWVATDYLQIRSNGNSQSPYQPVAFDGGQSSYNTTKTPKPVPPVRNPNGINEVYFDGPTTGNNTPVIGEGPMEKVGCPELQSTSGFHLFGAEMYTSIEVGGAYYEQSGPFGVFYVESGSKSTTKIEIEGDSSGVVNVYANKKNPSAPWYEWALGGNIDAFLLSSNFELSTAEISGTLSTDFGGIGGNKTSYELALKINEKGIGIEVALVTPDDIFDNSTTTQYSALYVTPKAVFSAAIAGTVALGAEGLSALVAMLGFAPVK